MKIVFDCTTYKKRAAKLPHNGELMTLNYDKMTILRIAKYYYLDGLSQQEISVKEGIHRTQISRILKLARELGYVQIRICTPDSNTADVLAAQLRDRLGLTEVFVAPALSTVGDQAESLYFFAARRLEQMLPHCKNVGIGVGKTLYHIAAQLTAQRLEHPPQFYSIAGTTGTDNPYLQASVIVDNFARPLGGRCHYNNFPLCLAREMMSTLDQARFEELDQIYQRLDMVVLSIGGPFNPDYPYLQEYSLVDREIDAAKATMKFQGNLLGHALHDDGSSYVLPQGYVMTSMKPSQLKQVSNVVCIASGKQKANALIIAARSGYIKTLITDEATAQQLLQLLS